jgi:peptide-methionine (R)-S-oxide reductase
MTDYGKSSDAIAALSAVPFRVTQRNGTEAPFENEFWDHKELGLYVDVVSGETLFTSLDKFDSACGWPSLTKPADSENVEERHDGTHGMAFDPGYEETRSCGPGFGPQPQTDL